MAEKKKAGFATIIGRPNVGKSTLMNHLIGQKIAITSYKPQTTRTQIRTVYTDEERGQIVFLDTPGLHRGSTRLGEYMVKAAESTLKEVDVILWLVEPKEKIGEEDQAILELLAGVKTPVILVINKVDSVNKEQVLAVIAAYSRAGHFAEIVPVSARSGEGQEELLKVVFSYLPEGDPFYDEETVTTQTEREIAAEIVREKALRLLQEEVPHGIAVTIEKFHYRERRPARRGKGRQGRPQEGQKLWPDSGIYDIEASIICEKDSHKGIIIGRGGAMLGKIGSAARRDIENMLQCQVNLKLFVKVRKDWKDDETQMKSFGYDPKKLK